MYFIHPALFWLTLGGAAVLTILAVINQRALAGAPRTRANLPSPPRSAPNTWRRNADSLIAMGMVSNVVNGWGDDHARALAAADKAAQQNAWFAGLSRLLRLGLQIAILGYGALLVLKGEMTAGMIFASSLISGRALQPIDQIIGSWRQLAAGPAKPGSAPMPSWTRRTAASNIPACPRPRGCWR